MGANEKISGDDVRQFKRRLSALDRERYSFYEHWKELSNYIQPTRGQFLGRDDKTNSGRKRYKEILDSSATIALRTLASGMMAGITSPARPWFRLATPDPDMMEYGPVKEYLFRVERIMREAFNKSNLYQALPNIYEETGLFGTGGMIVVEDYNNIIRCITMTAGEYMVANDDSMRIDTLYREIKLTVAQCASKFGLKNCSDHVKTSFNQGNLDRWVEIVHVIEPRTTAVGVTNKHMGWRSVYFEKSTPDGRKLSESGFNEFPAMIPRWHVSGTDVYGTNSPGIMALGPTKSLQVMQLRKAQGIDKMVNPPLRAPSSMKNQQLSTLPGGVSYLPPNEMQYGISPLYEVNPRLLELRDNIIETKDEIRQIFFADLFLMLANDTRSNITAREIEERHQEKLLMLGPVLERIHNDLLDPLIDRTFAIMSRMDVLPPAPEELQGHDLRVEYISVLAQAQRAIGVNSINQLLSTAGNMAQFKPDVLDKLDFDQVIDEQADMLGVPPRIIISDDKVRGLREQRRQQEQVAAMAQQAAASADTAKKLSETQTSEGDLLHQLTGL